MDKPTILIVDDEPDIRTIISEILDDEGFNTLLAENAVIARSLYQQHHPDLVLLDIWMPDTDGITLLKEWQEQNADADIIMISGHGTVETAVEAIRIGAYDFLEKPLSTAKLLVTVRRAIENRKLQNEYQNLKRRLSPKQELIGSSSVMQQLREKLRKLASTNSWVLIQGEPGSGKAVAARMLHQLSDRSDAPLVEINLAALPAENLSIQLFGRDDPNESITGSLEDANGGILVLDEVGDLDIELQGKLLSALNEKVFYRVGGREPIAIDVRVVATINQNLMQKISDGEFRRDLYDRLNQLPVFMPPLREHKEDIPELVNHFVHTAIEDEGFPSHRFSVTALNYMRSHNWPGNIRELNNFIHRMLISSEDEEIALREVVRDLSGDAPDADNSAIPSEYQLNLRDAREAFERDYLKHHLEEVGGNMSELAARTGLERTHLYRKLKGLGIDPKQAKSRQ